MPWRARAALYVVSVMEGRATGPWAWLLRLVLACGVPVYWLGLRWSRATTRSTRLACSVISVGNLTVGGTGKTPVVAWLARRLQPQGWRLAILSRGYGGVVGSTGLVNVDSVAAPAACYGDEPVWLARQLPGVPVLIGSDRLTNARDALRDRGINLFILDDGFQHWRLARDLDIVILDGDRPFGIGRLLPLGTLREPVSALRRVQVLLVRQTAEAGPSLDALREQLRGDGVTAPVVPIRYRPTMIEEPLVGRSRDVASLAGWRVRLLSAIGQPRAFESSVRALGAEVVGHRTYPDHYAYTADDMRQWNSGDQATPLLTTEKDWMRLEPLARATPPTAPLLVLRMVVELVNPDDEILLNDRLARLPRR